MLLGIIVCLLFSVTLSPNLKRFYLGESFYLSCEIAAVGEAIFFHNNEIFQKLNGRNLKVPVATSQHSGTYYCEIDNIRSSGITVTIMGKLNPPSH